MQICKRHWEALKTAIKERGLDQFGAKNSEELRRTISTELEGRAEENDWDPFWSAHMMIWNKGLEVCGLGLLSLNDDQSHKCPVCEAVRVYEEWWILGPADCMLKEGREKGLVQ